MNGKLILIKRLAVIYECSKVKDRNRFSIEHKWDGRRSGKNINPPGFAT